MAEANTTVHQKDNISPTLQSQSCNPCRLLAERGKLKGVLDSVVEAREGLERRTYDQEVKVRRVGGGG